MQTYNVEQQGACCFRCIRTQEVGIVEDLGQFKRLLPPGFHCIMWPLSNIVGKLSLRVQQLDVICETKTKDNVFLQVQVSVQYRVLQDAAYDAYYRLTDPRSQIQSYVFDVVRYVCRLMSLSVDDRPRRLARKRYNRKQPLMTRTRFCDRLPFLFSLFHRSTVPKLMLDDAFASKDDIASSVLSQLQHVMKDYGYEISNTLVTDLSPDAKVKASMNEINAARRLKVRMNSGRCAFACWNHARKHVVVFRSRVALVDVCIGEQRH
jgi:regulator of protease activity HflC (stomatin/prohibitin superfamily)